MFIRKISKTTLGSNYVILPKALCQILDLRNGQKIDFELSGEKNNPHTIEVRKMRHGKGDVRKHPCGNNNALSGFKYFRYGFLLDENDCDPGRCSHFEPMRFLEYFL